MNYFLIGPPSTTMGGEREKVARVQIRVRYAVALIGTDVRHQGHQMIEDGPLDKPWLVTDCGTPIPLEKSSRFKSSVSAVRDCDRCFAPKKAAKPNREIVIIPFQPAASAAG